MAEDHRKVGNNHFKLAEYNQALAAYNRALGKVTYLKWTSSTQIQLTILCMVFNFRSASNRGFVLWKSCCVSYDDEKIF